MKKSVTKWLMFIGVMFISLFFSKYNISASYYDYCNDAIIGSDNSEYYDCGDNPIYLMENDISKSSFLFAGENYEIKNKVVYAGKVDNIDTFYASAFNFYAVVYDDRNILWYDNDMWSNISINGESVYDGSFENSLIIDKSSKKLLPMYNEVGTYIIKQYAGGEIIKAIRVIVPDKNDTDIEVSDYMFGDILMDGSSTVDKYQKMSFYISGGKYGYSSKAYLDINKCSFEIQFLNNLVIDNKVFVDCLIENEKNNITLTLYNALNYEKIFNYNFILECENVSIKLESSVSALSTSSRRIVVKAKAGVGKTLDEENNLYYWSTSADDRLTYEDFLTNYENSENKGTYSANKGVILRGNAGVYYLYALASDDDSYVIVRSDKYILNESHSVNKIIYKDFILVGALCIVALLPVVIYLFVRGKDTY